MHRLGRIYGRDAVDIDRSTMAGWVGQSEKLFEPLVAALGRYTLATEKVHADETPVAVMDPGPDRTTTGRLSVYFRDGQLRRGKIIAMQDTQATVQEEGTKRTWKIPCLAMQRYHGAKRSTRS